MEGVHSRGRPQVLVQHRDEAELLGDARRLQGCNGRCNPDHPNWVSVWSDKHNTVSRC